MSALSLALDTPDLADHYERVSADRQFKSGQFLIEKLRIQPGEHVLDVGAGTGLLAEYVATLVGPKGTVVGIDPLALRIEIAKRKATKTLSFRVGGAEDLTAFANASLDVVYLNAVFHWLPEKLAPLREFLRVLKPGGRLGISTGARGSNSLRQLRKQILARPEYSAQVDPNDDVGHNVTADELRELLTQNGFAVEKLDVVTNNSFHPTPSAAIDFAQASSFGNFLGRVPESLRPNARREIEAELETRRTADGIPTQGARLIAIARKP